MRLHFKLDRQLHYSLHSRLYQEVRDGDKIVSQENSEYPATLVQKCLRVDPDGSGHLLIVTAPEEGANEDNRQVCYQHLDAQGAVLEITGPNPGSTYSFPAEAVGDGSKWSGVSRGFIPGRATPVLATFNYRVEGHEKIGDYDCLHIELDSDEIEFDLPVPGSRESSRVMSHTHGRMYFAPAEGLLIRLELKSLTRPKLGTLVSETHNTITQELRTADPR